MQTYKILSTALLSLTAFAAYASVSKLHEGDCPFCKLPLVQNTEKQDNEVVVKFGNKKIEYRCITCVFLDQKRFDGDLVVYAPSEKVGEPIVLKRTAGKWVVPEGTVFLSAFKKHKNCASLSRTFRTKKALGEYAKLNGAPDAKAMTVQELQDALAKKD